MSEEVYARVTRVGRFWWHVEVVTVATEPRDGMPRSVGRRHRLTMWGADRVGRRLIKKRARTKRWEGEAYRIYRHKSGYEERQPDPPQEQRIPPAPTRPSPTRTGP